MEGINVSDRLETLCPIKRLPSLADIHNEWEDKCNYYGEHCKTCLNTECKHNLSKGGV